MTSPRVTFSFKSITLLFRLYTHIRVKEGSKIYANVIFRAYEDDIKREDEEASTVSLQTFMKFVGTCFTKSTRVQKNKEKVSIYNDLM